jgi:hypothetical protein
MIPSTLTLLVAATSSVLSVNALPVLSGFFSRNTPASPAAALARRDLTSAQLAQGSNEFFKSLLFEDVCTPGQVACINNNTASCSGEGNWEITPCTGGTTCLALPVDSTSTSTSNATVVVECTNPATALTAIEQAGGSQDLAVNFSVTAAPFNATVTATPTASSTNSSSSFGFVPTATDPSGDAPTSTTTDNSTAPTSTCTDDGSYDGSDDGPNDGETDSETPTPTLGADVPTGTDASTDPTGTCSEDPEPTETEFITVVAFPNPTNSSQFSYSTVEPTETNSSNSTDATPTTDAYGSSPTDSTDVPAPTDSGNSTLPDVSPAPESISPDNSTVTATDGSTDPTSTDGNSTSPTTTTTTPGAPISTLGTFDIPAPQTFSDTGGFSVVSGPVPDVSALGTSEIPAPTTTGTPTRRGMQKKVRRS